MVIHRSGTCDYEATVEEIRHDDTIWAAHERLTDGERLVGRSPTICVDRERISLTAVTGNGVVTRQVVIPAGDAVFKAAKQGDRLFVTRTHCAAFGVSLIRNSELVLAFGAVTHVPLGTTVDVVRGPEVPTHLESIDETWLEVSSGEATARARAGEVQSVGGYEVYVERTWDIGMPGIDEQASIALATVEDLPLAAMRSAIIMANAPEVLRDFE